MECVCGQPAYCCLASSAADNYDVECVLCDQPACCCLAGSAEENDEVGEDEAKDRPSFLEAFDRCVAKASGT